MSTRLDHLLHSNTALAKGITNAPATGLHLRRLLWLCGVADEALYILREKYSTAKVNSGYRCPKLNEEVGGSLTSDHPRALGFDLGDGKTVDYTQWAQLLYDRRRDFATRPQQIIIEPGHVHIGMPDELEQEKGVYKTELLLKLPNGKFKLLQAGA